MLFPLPATVTRISLSCFTFSKQIEMLQAKQQEEIKRLREQMEAEAKTQRDQMNNMTKASMKNPEIMQENQALMWRLLELIQKSNEGWQQRMKTLLNVTWFMHLI